MEPVVDTKDKSDLPEPVVKIPVYDLGPVLEGAVIKVTDKEVELKLDDGRPAVIDRSNFGLHNESPNQILSIGDKSYGVELKREDKKNRVVLSRSWALKKQAWEKIAKKVEDNKLFKGKVTEVRKNGIIVDIGLPGYLPASHLELEKISDFKKYLGQILEVKVIEADPKTDKLIVSRRSQLHKNRRKEQKEFLGSLKNGQVLNGVVDSLSDYGVFVKLSKLNETDSVEISVTGLVHVSELSWDHVKNPSEVCAVGDALTVTVLDVKVGKGKVSLSAKANQPDPISVLEIGSVIQGTVSSVTDFGAFVTVGDFDGLVHMSELSEYRVGHPSEVVMPGEQVSVKVLSVDPKKRRIGLSIRQAVEYSG